jgi:hypothetical protein
VCGSFISPKTAGALKEIGSDEPLSKLFQFKALWAAIHLIIMQNVH